ncbi:MULTISPECIES: small heat shock chaperone IbpB [Yersinia]|uniref:Small heat shock protein IbpB n=1 Tax=Yersinia rochesterensis TaxID=1604335 RepID=A0A386HJJ2_9GAMM|nr:MULTISPECIES: small heat shock chaperone IbpB [Yersinia]AJI86110.1 small heat shock protein ibpB [Yersinia frederiksenii Y225]CNH63598.1 heat shock chaperone IbpB [Yersinia kristensenii]AIN17865.1 hsp20/alpha crystallin family protein [Yersinia rochesterensis]AJJ36523.1 hsp20/alpha crystallin family protein [Yersinia rochesterensis]AYD45806.1 heat shock chaperone IbpB [Yersinia rochesterensis]
MRNYDLSPLLRQWIGFDKLANSMQGGQDSQGFPPYNIEKTDDNHYRISLALAGFKQSELDIEVEGPRLTVRGKPAPAEKQVEYLHQGLVHKEFSLTFTLAEHLNVDNAQFENGLLHIDLLRQVPEALQPQRISIGSAAPQEHQVLDNPAATEQSEQQ